MVKQTNNSFIIIIILLCIIIFYLLYIKNTPIQRQQITTRYESANPALVYNPQPNFNIQMVQDNKDTVRNPYAPPIRYYEETEYKQLGYLTNQHNNTKVILFGKPAHFRRDKWYYYTIIDNIKYPIEINRKKCSIQPGCDSVSTKDVVQVDGINYMVTMYDFNL
jgi:hypothetical protein